MLYSMHADKQPVMLYDIQEGKIYAYPYTEFKAEMNPRSQAMLEEHRQQALTGEYLILFIRDNIKRKLVSYTLPLPPAEQLEEIRRRRAAGVKWNVVSRESMRKRARRGKRKR